MWRETYFVARFKIFNVTLSIILYKTYVPTNKRSQETVLKISSIKYICIVDWKDSEHKSTPRIPIKNSVQKNGQCKLHDYSTVNDPVAFPAVREYQNFRCPGTTRFDIQRAILGRPKCSQSVLSAARGWKAGLCLSVERTGACFSRSLSERGPSGFCSFPLPSGSPPRLMAVQSAWKPIVPRAVHCQTPHGTATMVSISARSRPHTRVSTVHVHAGSCTDCALFDNNRGWSLCSRWGPRARGYRLQRRLAGVNPESGNSDSADRKHSESRGYWVKYPLILSQYASVGFGCHWRKKMPTTVVGDEADLARELLRALRW